MDLYKNLQSEEKFKNLNKLIHQANTSHKLNKSSEEEKNNYIKNILNKSNNNTSIQYKQNKSVNFGKSSLDTNTVFSNPIKTPINMSGVFRSTSKSKYNRCKSPTSQFIQSKSHKYHTDVDYNYLMDQKFKKDAAKCGRSLLSSTALRESSPDKYFYEKTQNLSQNGILFSYQNEDNNNETGGETLKPLNIKKSNEFNELNKVNSENILSDVFDSQFSINSPSNIKVYQNEIEQLQNEEFRNKFRQSQENNKIYVEDDENAKVMVNLSYVGENPQQVLIEAYENLLEYIDPVFENYEIDRKLDKLINVLDSDARSIKLGAIMCVYFILKKYQVDDGLKFRILEKTICLVQNYEIQEELFLVCCLDLLGLFGPHELILENIDLISIFLTDFNFPRLQKSAFNCLMFMEYRGIQALIDLANKDYPEYQRYILSNMARTPHIQKIIIIRALFNDLFSNIAERRHSALAALNRMYDLISDYDGLSKLASFFQDPKLEKIFLASTIRTSGPEGEKMLLNELKNNKDFSVRVAIASVLFYRPPLHPKYLDIYLDKNDIQSNSRSLPGNFCTYYGRVSPVVLEKEEDSSSNFHNRDYLLVNSRDFLAALKRMLLMNYDHSNPQLCYNDKLNILDNFDFNAVKNEIAKKYNNLLSRTFNEGDEEHENQSGLAYISEDVIKALTVCLKDYSTAVRHTAASSLGQIGLPESLLAIEALIEANKDEDVNVRSKAIWAIGKIALGCDNSVVIPIVESLKSNMWKVKSACLYTLSCFGHRAAKYSIPVLLKLLKETAINKQTVAETLVKMGNDGESCLLKLFTSENDSNYKLKSSIAKAFALANIESPNIDFIIESLFKAANSSNNIIRKSALFSIRMLADRSDERITYLKKKNIIPFYYHKLCDKDYEIQAFAISAIKSIGPQGELLFIEGLTKDSNPVVRAQCAIGLAEIGPTTLRSLLIGFHDENSLVRKTVEQAIIDKFSIESIIQAFENKGSQLLSLKIAIRDILEKAVISSPLTRRFTQDLLIALERHTEVN